MRIAFKTLLVGSLLWCPTALLAQVTTFEIETYDLNNDLLLSDTERNALRRDVANAENEVTAYYYLELKRLEKLYGASGPIPIAVFEKPIGRIECDFSQRLFLRKDVTSVPVSDCVGLRPQSDGAAFSLVEDRKADETTVSADGGLGVVLIRSDRFDLRGMENKRDFALSDIALVGFAEADGVLGTDESDRGYLRAGLKVESAFSSALFPKLGVGVTAYRQTDLALDSEGYGAQLSLVPQRAADRLNGFITTPGKKSEFYFVARGIVDGFRVDDPGDTGLAEDDFVWVGGKFGFEYIDKRFVANGVLLNVTLDTYYDLLDGREAVDFTAGLEFLLDEKGGTALGIEYKQGEKRQDLESEERISFDLKVKF